LNFAERKNFRLQAKYKIIRTLALLLTAATGAWAADTYTITFSGFGNENCNKTVTDATLEYSETFNIADVDGNYMQLYDVGGSNEYVSISNSQEEITITVKSAFEGTVNVTVNYVNGDGDETFRDISVTCVKSATTIDVTPVTGKTNEWTFTMPAFDVDVEVTFTGKGNNILVMPSQLGNVYAFDSKSITDASQFITEAETGKEIYLVAINDFLLKQAVLITDGAAMARQMMCCHGIDKAGSKSAQTAVAQARIGFFFINLVQIQLEVAQRFLNRFLNAQIDQIGF
jgi:hypothetical protein